MAGNDVTRVRYPMTVYGRPRGNGPGITKNCQYGVCKSDSRKFWKTGDTSVSFVPFPKPCLEFRKGLPSHQAKDCQQCAKATRWLSLCRRGDGRFNKLENIKPYHYICSLHFMGEKGPTEDCPDPILDCGNVSTKQRGKSNRTEVENKIQVGEELTSLQLSEIRSVESCVAVDQIYDVTLMESINSEETTSRLYKMASEKVGAIDSIPLDKDVERRLYTMALMLVDECGLSVELTKLFLSLKVCNGMYVNKEFRFFEPDAGRVEVYGFNRLLPTSHEIYGELQRLPIEPANVNSLKRIITDWKCCCGNEDKVLVDVFSGMDSRKKGKYIKERDAIYSTSCVILVKDCHTLCGPCGRLKHFLEKESQRKNNDGSMKTIYRKMSHSDLIKNLKIKSRQSLYYKRQLAKVRRMSEQIHNKVCSSEEANMTVAENGSVNGTSNDVLVVTGNTVLMRSVLKTSKTCGQVPLETQTFQLQIVEEEEETEKMNYQNIVFLTDTSFSQ